MANVVEQVQVQMTDKEVRLRGEELARATRERAEMEEARREANKEWKDKLDALDQRITQLANSVATRSEVRPIECGQQVNPDSGTVDVFRLDTGEVVRTRPMTEREREEARQPRLLDLPRAVSAATGGRVRAEVIEDAQDGEE